MSSKTAPSRAQAYVEAGVDINAGNLLVERIKKVVAKTHTHGVLSDIGGFGGLYKPDIDNIEAPVLVASTDGVGTKLKLAFAFNRHNTVGIDLVAMSANDILVQGARPLFFLDYFATGKLDLDTAEAVISGVADGCRQAGCALLGGETAEMPDMYAPGEYDLAGFCVGIVSNNKIVDGSGIKAGDAIIGMASSGPHANGYSLIRKILAESGLKGDDTFPGMEESVADVLLAPTTIYVDAVRGLLRDMGISGMVHITGGGFYDNIPRVLPPQAKAVIKYSAWPMPQVFQWLGVQGGLSLSELFQIFNCGIGFILILSAAKAEECVSRLRAQNLEAWVIGSVERLGEKDKEQVEIIFSE